MNTSIKHEVESMTTTTSSSDDDDHEEDEFWWKEECEKYLSRVIKNHKLFVISLIPVLILFGPSIIGWLLHVIGTATGIAIGLGFTTYVYDFFQSLHSNDSNHTTTSTASTINKHKSLPSSSRNAGFKKIRSDSTSNTTSTTTTATATSSSNSSSSTTNNDANNTYTELMASAGYHSHYFPRGVILRGQILRNVPTTNNSTTLYPFDGTKGPETMTKLWPKLSPSINKEWGLLIDLLMRDYVASWYCKLDTSVPIPDIYNHHHHHQDDNQINQPINNNKKDQNNIIINDNNHNNNNDDDTNCQTTQEKQQQQQQQRLHNTMVLSTAKSHLAPFMELLYNAIVTVLGTFSSVAAENINVATLICDSLLPLINDQIRTYRDLRRIALQKQMRKTSKQNTNRIRRLTRGMVTGGVAAIPSGKVISRDKTTNTNTNNNNNNNSNNNNNTTVSESQQDTNMQQSVSSTLTSISETTTTTTTEQNNDPNDKQPQKVSTTGDERKSTDGSKSSLSEPSFKGGVVSEIEMIREYLLAGKFHRAITFGLDVPSVLFADPTGKDCPIFTSGNNDNKESNIDNDPDVVLVQRILNSDVLNECELDYNRVIAHRLSRSLLPRNEFNSTVVRSAIVEMMASCVLTPSLGCITPDFVNQWIITNLSGASTTTTTTDESKDMDKRLSVDTDSDLDQLLHNEMDTGVNSPDLVIESEKDSITLAESENKQSNTTGKETLTQTDIDNGVELSLEESSAYKKSSTHEEEGEDRVLEEENIVEAENISSIAEVDEDIGNIGEQILPLVTMALIELQAYIDLEDVRTARELRQENMVDWDDAGCRESVNQLLLVVECALTHGVRSCRRKKGVKQNPKQIDGKNPVTTVKGRRHSNSSKADPDIEMEVYDNSESNLCIDDVNVSISEDYDIEDEVGDVDENEDDREHLEPSSLTTVLMEMTSDLESFERKIEEEEQKSSTGETTLYDFYEKDEEDAIPVSSLPKLSSSEVSTLRTLIAAWLHTGQLFRMISVYIRSKRKILYPFYHKDAFLQIESNASGFMRQLRALDEVDILVDTMAVLSCQSLDLTGSPDILASFHSNDEGDQDETEDSKKDLSKGSIPLQSKQQNFALSRSLNNDSSNNTELGQNGSTLNEQPHGINAIGRTLGATLQNRRKKLSRLVVGGAKDVTNLKRTILNQPSLESMNSTTSIESSNNVSTHLDSTMNETRSQPHHHDQLSQSTPLYLKFHTNEAFSSSLRTERERRLSSWITVSNHIFEKERRILDAVYRNQGKNEQEKLIHRELHQLARCFYSNSNILALQYALARSSSTKDGNDTSVQTPDRQALITMETVSSRRRIEVPDDDSSFLLRAQPRALNPIGVHRDPRNHEMSYRCFAATYEEPTRTSVTLRKGRSIRRCLLRYFPSDRTANIQAINETRRLDFRRRDGSSTNSLSNQQYNVDDNVTLSKEFQQQRNLCKKYQGRGSDIRSTGILASTIMEPNEFNAVPRTGKALDFVYRMTLFEKPTVELGGKIFTIHDSSAVGAHRADGSSLEVSDASLSVALLLFGSGTKISKSDSAKNLSDVESTQKNNDSIQDNTGSSKNNQDTDIVQSDPRRDSPPMVLMKISDVSKSSETKQPTRAKSKSVEVRPYRPSFVRAALMVTSARQEAQLQCLVACVRSGSARNATKARTESILKTTLLLLDFANGGREKESILLRDLKLGLNHIDKAQLRRNGLLNPRYPTLLRTLTVSVEDTVQAKISNNIDILGGNPTVILYKIRCTAVSEFVDPSSEDNREENKASSSNDPLNKSNENGVSPGESKKAQYGDLLVEEWVVYRQFRDFSALHRHLKSQVNPSESSAGAGAKIVGAATGLATAALNMGTGNGPGGGNQMNVSRGNRKSGLVPSLGQATKANALGVVTKKSIEKRRVYLNQYLNYLLSPKNLLNQCPELLKFLGAYVALPSEVKVNGTVLEDFNDALGRSEMKRSFLNRDTLSVPMRRRLNLTASSLGPIISKSATSTDDDKASFSSSQKQLMKTSDPNASIQSATSPKQISSQQLRKISSAHQIARSAVLSRIRKVKFSNVRNVCFDIVRNLFDLDNASFFRSRMISALKTMSYAVTSAQEFKKVMLENHLTYINGKKLSEYIKMIREILWPDGVFFTPSPPLTEKEKSDLESDSLKILLRSFPDQVKTVLGNDISNEGLFILHELLQNRVVLKSITYMIIDTILLEMFPEMGDILTKLK